MAFLKGRRRPHLAAHARLGRRLDSTGPFGAPDTDRAVEYPFIYVPAILPSAPLTV